MRALLMVAAMVTLAGCSSEFREEVEAQPPPANQKVVINYKGPQGYDLAVGKANEWCDARFGRSDVHLLKNDKKAGRAVFACEPL
jgi:hypothetical protein